MTEEKINEIAITDQLTGLKNRHFLDNIIESEIQRSQRYNTNLSIILFDLDKFKLINDSHGHPIGDEVLKQTAFITQNILRKSDIICRLGGEEFMVILPDTDIDGAGETAEKIRRNIEMHSHPVAGRYTASFGIAQYVAPESFIKFYNRVDSALYIAKESGRNKVVRYNDGDIFPVALRHLEWKPEWLSSNKIIDEQHLSLLDYTNSLMFLSVSGHSKEDIAEQLESLMLQIKKHFKYEELFLEDIQYPEIDKHIAEHIRLVDEFSRMRLAYLKGSIKLDDVFDFLLNELIKNHIVLDDIKYFSYIKPVSYT